MNTPGIDFSEGIRENHGLIGDFSNYSAQYLGNQQSWNMEICTQPAMIQAGSQQQNFRPGRSSSSSIMSQFESPASAFYATERCMRFQQYDQHVNSPVYSSKYPHNSYDSQISSNQFSGENYSVDSAEPLQSVVEPNFPRNNSYKSSDSTKCLFSSSSGNKIHSHEQNKLLSNDAIGSVNHFSPPFQRHQDLRDQVDCNSYKSPFHQLCFSSQQEKQSPRFSSGAYSVSLSGNTASTGAVLNNKTRIRWTQDLHEKFVECVNRLGGAEKATPKAILKLMDSDGLTIFHVKSHLQKYRIAKYMPDSSEGKSEKRTNMNDVSQIDVKTGFQIREALQLQLDVQRRLHEQLEIQRNLQLRIEEQGKQLKMMIDQQQKTRNFSDQNVADITSPDESSFCVEDIGISTPEAHFSSKIR